jgi:hypothetical protein
MPNVAELQIQVRKGTAAEWITSDPILLSGEIGYEIDTGYWKVGDGTTAWTSLTRMNPNPASQLLLMGA